jgi:glycosyltransferase involved in cell wall biosynthesis
LRFYRRLPLITISPSSAESLRALGLLGQIDVIPMATDFEAEPLLPPHSVKESEWTLVTLGRVVPSKRVQHVVQSLPALSALGFPARLWVVGAVQPSYQRQLERLAARLGVGKRVTFWGKVSETQKRDLLRRAHLLAACSVREGWGLMVTEANRAGTPAVVYDVPGLRDSTRHGVTGLVCERAEPMALARAVSQLLGEQSTYARMRQAAWVQAASLNWDRTAQLFLAAVEAARKTAVSAEFEQ